MIFAKDLSFSYDDFGRNILRDIDLSIAPGSFTAIVGANGCGKSTLVKHFNALLPLQTGQLTVAGIDASQESSLWKLRRQVGMVFQNPDNQFVSTQVGEDVAFGLENYGVSWEEIPERVSHALALVGMAGSEARSTHMLSGGQKQRVALAGVLAVNPDILVFDEATSMLDPMGRREVLEWMHALHSREGKTVVMITHYIEEAVRAEQVILMDGGRILASGSPREILTDRALLETAGLIPPMPVRMYEDLKAAGIQLSFCPLTNEELTDALCQLS